MRLLGTFPQHGQPPRFPLEADQRDKSALGGTGMHPFTQSMGLQDVHSHPGLPAGLAVLGRDRDRDSQQESCCLHPCASERNALSPSSVTPAAHSTSAPWLASPRARAKGKLTGNHTLKEKHGQRTNNFWY